MVGSCGEGVTGGDGGEKGVYVEKSLVCKIVELHVDGGMFLLFLSVDKYGSSTL